MRSGLPLLSLLAIVMGLAACSTRTPATPPEALGEPQAMAAAGDQQLLGLYRLWIDPHTLAHELSPVERAAAAQPPQAIYYDLEINRFLSFADFQIIGIGLNADGDLQVRFRHGHPFPAPDFALPATALNRADLSYSGRLLVLPATGTQSFFGGTVSLNPRLVPDADGYVSTGSLLSTPGFVDATAPYRLLVDEALDNRVALSNGGNPRGNYDPALGGWQQSNGPAWTGFDSLHGGERAINTFTLDAGELDALGGELHLAVLIKYCDPRGAGGRINRLPLVPFNVLDFAYRQPFGALDVSHVALASPLRISDQPGASAPVQLSVRDWDARAVEAGDSNLSDELDVTLIPPGTSGVPTVAIDSGALGAGVVDLSPSGTSSGRPGDELTFIGTLTNMTALAAGEYLALARAIDPENDIDTTAYHMGLPPDSETPSPSLALPLVTYQVIPFTVEAVSAPPVIESVIPTGVVGFSGEEVTFVASATGAPTTWGWDFAGATTPDTSTEPQPTVRLGAPGTYTGMVLAANAFGPSELFEFSFTIEAPPPAPAIVSVSPTGTLGESGTQVAFSAVTTGEVTSYSWNFDNGASPNTPTVPNPLVTLGAAGSYNGTLLVSGPGGDSDPFGFSFTVTAPVLPPEISAVSPTGVVGEEGQQVTFSATASNGPTGWSWEFGGGASPNTSTEATPLVTLGAPGTYNGSVIASNDGGASAPFGFTFTVEAGLDPPQVLSVSPTGAIGEVDDSVQFSANVQGPVDTYAWSFIGFGSPSSSGSPTPTITLTTAGTFSGSLTVSNGAGSSAPFPFSVTITEPPAGPTWSQIHTMIRFGDPEVSASNCIQCHAFGAGGLFMTSDPDVTYNNIVNQASSCGLDYIEPSQPSNSLIYRKISQPNPPCGERMPRNGQYWTAEAIQMVFDWIAAGANP